MTDAPCMLAIPGYEPVDVHFTANGWGGLKHQKSGVSLLDGTVNHGNWYYAVGTQRAWHGGIAGAAHAESQVELYVLISQQHLAWRRLQNTRGRRAAGAGAGEIS